ncbi:MAG: L,D-transpeptidase [Ktedonobacteraceae bacterium]
MTYLSIPRPHMRKSILVLSMAMLVMPLLSACSGDPQIQQRADFNKARLDSQLTHAQSIGVPGSMLQPIIHQAEQLNATSAPITLFNHQTATDYYSNLEQRYQMLTVQIRGLEQQATQQLDYQATLDLQDFEGALSQRQAQGFIEAKTFADQLTQDQALLAKARYPKDYIHISNNAKRSTLALRLMGPTYNNLLSLQQVSKQLAASHLDTTALDQEVRNDLQLFRRASKPEDFAQLNDWINAQLQQTTVFSSQAIPYVGALKLKQFSVDIDQVRRYGQDVTTFQQRLTADQAALGRAKSLGDYLKVSAQIDRDIASIQFPMLKAQANYLLKQFHQEVTSWGNAHKYRDSYNGVAYNQDFSYDQQGIGADLDQVVQSAQTSDDYQAAIDLITNSFTNLKAMEADANDTRPWNQPHSTDLQLMRYYKLTSGQVVVVSLIEQSWRLYQDGKLVKAFQITTGQYERPTPPGLWQVFLRQSPTVFKSSESKDSAFWYPDTPIQYAMEYHEGGYFFHDSWWRVNYGVGTDFPHYDTGGDESFAGNGSHGCINMAPADAKWMYENTGYGLAVLIY